MDWCARIFKFSAVFVLVFVAICAFADPPTGLLDDTHAAVISGRVRTDGYILGIGTISHFPLKAVFNQRVKKSGSTSSVTRSSISGLNATVKVT
jgi:hypothetical protein